MIADGNPATIRGINQIGLERKGVPAETIKLIREAFRIIYRSKYNTRQALEAMEKELPASPRSPRSASSSKKASADLFADRYSRAGD